MLAIPPPCPPKSAEVLFQFREPRKVAELGSKEVHLQEPVKPECFQDYDFNLLIFCRLFKCYLMPDCCFHVQ